MTAPFVMWMGYAAFPSDIPRMIQDAEWCERMASAPEPGNRDYFTKAAQTTREAISELERLIQKEPA
jgi:hypothetical protein